MEYKVLSGPFNAGQLERDLNGDRARAREGMSLP